MRMGIEHAVSVFFSLSPGTKHRKVKYIYICIFKESQLIHTLYANSYLAYVHITTAWTESSRVYLKYTQVHSLDGALSRNMEATDLNF